MNAKVYAPAVFSWRAVADQLTRLNTIKNLLVVLYAKSEDQPAIRETINQACGAWMVFGRRTDENDERPFIAAGWSASDYTKLECEVLAGKHLLTRIFLQAEPLSLIQREIAQSSVYGASPRRFIVSDCTTRMLNKGFVKPRLIDIEQQGREFQ